MSDDDDKKDERFASRWASRIVYMLAGLGLGFIFVTAGVISQPRLDDLADKVRKLEQSITELKKSPYSLDEKFASINLIRQREMETALRHKITRLLEKTTGPGKIHTEVATILDEDGDIKKISATVLIDGIYILNNDGSETYKPRKMAELELISTLVKGVIAFDHKRGDNVEIINMLFHKN
jgi:flagellar biosynthesis/type III secretory pathway M-ring protein FliF/YscJ